MLVSGRSFTKTGSHERAYLAVKIRSSDNERPYPLELLVDYVHGSLTPTCNIVRGAA